MKQALSILLALCLFAAAMSAPVQAKELAPAPAEKADTNAPEDPALTQVYKAFRNFAGTWINKLNRNHFKGFARMEVVPVSTGYKAMYHRFDPNTVICQVKRTKSSSVPYVGILKYKERIYESTGNSPQDCKNGDFATVKTIAVTEIFNYKNGAWQ